MTLSPISAARARSMFQPVASSAPFYAAADVPALAPQPHSSTTISSSSQAHRSRLFRASSTAVVPAASSYAGAAASTARPPPPETGSLAESENPPENPPPPSRADAPAPPARQPLASNAAGARGPFLPAGSGVHSGRATATSARFTPAAAPSGSQSSRSSVGGNSLHASAPLPTETGEEEEQEETAPSRASTQALATTHARVALSPAQSTAAAIIAARKAVPITTQTFAADGHHLYQAHTSWADRSAAQLVRGAPMGVPLPFQSFQYQPNVFAPRGSSVSTDPVAGSSSTLPPHVLAVLQAPVPAASPARSTSPARAASPNVAPDEPRKSSPSLFF